MTETERVKETIEMLKVIDVQIRPMGKHCKIESVEADSARWVLKEAIDALEYLNNIRWDDTELFKGGI